MDFLKKLFADKNDNNHDKVTVDEQQLAVASLLVEAARADQSFDSNERAIIIKFLSSQFSLSTQDASRLCDDAETAQENAVDIHRFTRHAKEYSQAEKIAFVEALWRIVLSDGERDAYEDALIRRVCGLIYVSDRESAEARQAAELGPSKG